MIHPAFIHLGIALAWMFLGGNTTLGGFASGLVFGFIAMALFRNALHCRHYIRRVLAGVRFFFHFIYLILLSNLKIARAAILREAPRIKGEFLVYRIDGLTDFETLLLCQCIGLTPGTIVTDRIPNDSALILHAFASGTAEEIRRFVDQELKYPILLFTR